MSSSHISCIGIAYRLAACVILTQACGWAQLTSIAPKAFFSLQAPDQISASTVDSAGNVYITGFVHYLDVPVTAGAFQTVAALCNPQCVHTFVAKFSADGTQLLYSTYLGGSGSDMARAIAVDSSGNVYVAGSTTSRDFPVTSAAYQTAPGDGFIARLSADGTALLASTYVAGANPSKLVLDSSGAVYVAGGTTGNPFATTPAAFQTAAGGVDAFVLKIDPLLRAPIYSSRFGGSSADVANALAVGSDGSAYIAGNTSSLGAAPNSFPVTGGALSPVVSGPDAAFLLRLSADGSRFIFANVFGGPYTFLFDVALDASGAIYLAGTSTGGSTPAANFLPRKTSFVEKLIPGGNGIVYSVQLPLIASSSPVPLAKIEVINTDHLLIRGIAGPGAPVVSNAPMPCSNGTPSGFLLELNSTGTAVFGTYLNNAIALDTVDVWSASQNPNRLLDKTPVDGSALPGLSCIASSATFIQGPVAPGEIVTLFGSGIGPAQPAQTQLDSSGNVSAVLGGLSVYFNGIASPLLYVSGSQINVVVPFEMAGRNSASVIILKDGVILPEVDVGITTAVPAIFNVSSGPAIVNQDGTLNSQVHPAPAGSAVTVYMTGAGLMTPLPATGSIGQGTTNVALTASARASWTEPSEMPAGHYYSVPADVLYAGDAPDLVQGAVQINVRVPAGTGSSVVLTLFFGGPGGPSATALLWVQ